MNAQVQLQLSVGPVGKTIDHNSLAITEPTRKANALAVDGSLLQALPAPLKGLKRASQ